MIAVYVGMVGLGGLLFAVFLRLGEVLRRLRNIGVVLHKDGPLCEKLDSISTDLGHRITGIHRIAAECRAELAKPLAKRIWGK